MTLPPEALVELVARNPGHTAKELLRILAREGRSDLTKSQLNSALYRNANLRYKERKDLPSA